MERNYLEYIEKFLSETPVMLPEATNMLPEVSEDPGLKAVLFDVYGTIIISASGDVDESEITSANLRRALDAAGIAISISSSGMGSLLLQILESFRKQILAVHESEKNAGKPFPEVDIMQIWETVITEYSNKKLLIVKDSLCIKCFTFVFEVLSNTIYPMPGMRKVISSLAEKEFPMGIVSNAQFYTPVILNYFLNDQISESVEVKPFDKTTTVFSFQYGRSKPDPFLFEIVKNQFQKKYGLDPSEVLFVGNDMYRDIYPAHRTGFKTALFAGDARSLRLREEKTEVNGLKPDYILTNLDQLLKILT